MVLTDRATELSSKYAKPGERLTRMESIVRDHIIHGRMNKEIGAILNISHRTVEAHRARIFTKYGVRNAVELVGLLLGSEAAQTVV